MVGFNGNFLFDKRVNGFLTKMDDSTSMVSLALRDSVESSGRTYMEYKRDKHGGRERLIEEAATMVIWGFGINWMKKAYDWMAKDVTKAIGLPDLDISLLKPAQEPKANQSRLATYFKPPSSQSLVEDGKMSKTIRNFTKQVHDDTGKNIYGKLIEVVEKDGLKKVYNASNMLKFFTATGIPVLAIAFGIPTFNQWLTKNKIEKAKANQSVTNPFSPAAKKSFSGNPAFNSAFTGFKNTNATPSAPYSNGFGGRLPANARFSGQAQKNGLQKNNGKVQFGGLMDAGGNVAASFLQNERMNTLLVDNIISGGRVVKARNWQERLEITLRELSIIGCLYWLQQFLQEQFISKLAKKSHSQLGFDATKHLKDKFLNPNAESFAQAYTKDLNELAKSMGYTDGKGLVEAIKNAKTPDLRFKLDQGFTTAVLEHFKLNKPNARPDNLFLEVAKECNWIPTFDGEMPASKNAINTIMNSAKGWTKDAGSSIKALLGPNNMGYTAKAAQYLDLTQKIKSESMLSFIEHMDDAFVSKIKSNPAQLESVLKSAIRGRAGAWLVSNAVCTLLLSFLIPKAQHYLTYRMTGKNYFPGVQPSA